MCRWSDWRRFSDGSTRRGGGGESGGGGGGGIGRGITRGDEIAAERERVRRWYRGGTGGLERDMVGQKVSCARGFRNKGRQPNHFTLVLVLT